MRTKEEIKQAVAILRHKGDRLSQVMAETLQGSMTEQQVFQKYVMEVAESSRDESVFFAARDAARFSAGHIGLEELIPDVQSMSAGDFEAAGAWGNMEEVGTVTLSCKDFKELIQRIDRLEQWVGFRRKPTTVKPSPMPEDMNTKDMVIQRQACAYLKCSKISIKKLVAQHVLHAYQKGRNVYYSQKELDKYLKTKRAKEE